MKFKPGDTASLSKTIDDDEILAFANATGDRNPLHLDEEFAKQTRFGKRIAHGMLSASLISAVIAHDLPGQGSIYLDQTLQFVAPVFPGDTVTARVTVTAIMSLPAVSRKAFAMTEVEQTLTAFSVAHQTALAHRSVCGGRRPQLVAQASVDPERKLFRRHRRVRGFYPTPQGFGRNRKLV
jgi:3-hydroxybutyryl-CoA dehydratase